MIETFANGEINERSLNNPHPSYTRSFPWACVLIAATSHKVT